MGLHFLLDVRNFSNSYGNQKLESKRYSLQFFLKALVYNKTLKLFETLIKPVNSACTYKKFLKVYRLA